MKHLLLKNSLANVTVAPELGGALLSYNANVDGVLRAIFKNSVGATQVGSSSCFPLVPYSNRIREGKFTWQGKTITLPLNFLPQKHSNHGHGWQTSWTVLFHSDERVIIEYQHQADDWPFSYTTRQTISLHGPALELKLSLINTSSFDMPAGLGLHPYFTRTQLTTLHCDVNQMWDVDNESMPLSIIDAPVSLIGEAGLIINEHQLDNAFINFPAKAIITWPEWQVKATICSSSKCQFMVVYSPKNESFFCVEPVTHCTDAINLEQKGVLNTGAQVLKSNEEIEIFMKITPESINVTKCVI